jgi:patatin-related protein
MHIGAIGGVSGSQMASVLLPEAMEGRQQAETAPMASGDSQLACIVAVTTRCWGWRRAARRVQAVRGGHATRRGGRLRGRALRVMAIILNRSQAWSFVDVGLGRRAVGSGWSVQLVHGCCRHRRCRSRGSCAQLRVKGLKAKFDHLGGQYESENAMGDMTSPTAVGGSSAGGRGISADDRAGSGAQGPGDEYLSVGRATRPGPHTQDLRIAVAMTGGVSLAVWIGGVARELNLLQQAAWLRDGAPHGGSLTGHEDTTDADRHVRSRYLRLINLLDITVSIDILSGTGAGGINAALLGMARARPCDLGPLRDMWLEAGAFETLMRDPAEQSPPSLLHGDLLLDRLCSEMRKLGDRPPPVQPPPGACGPGSSHPETRVFITTTLLTGETSRFTDDAGTLVQDVDHRGLFVFNEGDLADRGAYDALALAARSSASFPVAFEPAFVAHDEVSARRRGPRHPAMKKYANITRSHWAADGGLLMNRPINPLLRAIFDRTAERQVRRILLYVVPSPGDPAPASETSAEMPPTFDEALSQDFSAVLNQSISADLKALREHNDRVDSLRVTRVRMAEFGIRLRQAAGEQPGTVPGGLVTTQMMDDYCHRQARFLVRPVVDALMRVLTTIADGDLPPPFRPPVTLGRNQERDCQNAAAARIAESWLPLEGEAVGVDRYQRLERFGRAPYDGAEATVLSMLRAGFTLVATDDQRKKLVLLGHAVHRAFAPTTRPDVEDFVSDKVAAYQIAGGTLADLAGQIAIAYAEELARPGPRREGYELPPGEDASLASGWQRLAEAVAGSYALLRDLADAALDDKPPEAGLSAYPAAPGQDALRQRQSRAAAELDTYLQFLGPEAGGIADGLFDLYVATRSVLPVGLEVEQRIELVQLSADSRNLLAPDRDTAKSKLTGLQLYQLGAFYKSSWRANDWTWGRLDGAGWLVHLLLDPRRVLTITKSQQPGRRASWFYDQLRHTLMDGVESHERQAILDELAYLDDDTGEKHTPASLPLTALWVASSLQQDIAATELPVIAREILSTPSRHHSHWAQEVLMAAGQPALATAAARAATEAAASGHWSRAQRVLRKLSDQEEHPESRQSDPGLVAKRLADCPVPAETLADEVGEPLFTRTASQAAAVAAAVVTGAKKPPSALRAIFTTSRHVTMAGYRAAVITGGRPRSLIVGGAVVLLLGLVAAIQGPSLLGLTGILLLLFGAYLVALGTWWTSWRALRLVAVVTVAGLVFLPDTPVARRWLFGEACATRSCANSGEVGHLVPWLRGSWHWPIFAAFAVVLLVILTRRRAAVASPHGQGSRRG